MVVGVWWIVSLLYRWSLMILLLQLLDGFRFYYFWYWLFVLDWFWVLVGFGRLCGFVSMLLYSYSY